MKSLDRPQRGIAPFLAEYPLRLPFLLYRPGAEPHLFRELLGEEDVSASSSSARR